MALSRVKSWSSGEILTASDLNAEFNNVLNNALTLISPLTAALDAGSNRIHTLGAATALNDAIRATQVQNSGTTYLTSVAGTNTITATATPTPSAYATGQEFTFIPAATNTGATTINVSSLGAKNIFRNNIACKGNELRASVPARVVYDGTQFQIVGSDRWQTIMKRADEARNSTTTLTADTDLVIPVLATTNYAVRGNIVVRLLSASDFKFQVDVPAAATLSELMFRITDHTTNPGSELQINNDSGTAHEVLVGSNISIGIQVSGFLQNGANAGNISFTWAQVTSGGTDTIVRACSYLEYMVAG